MPGGARVSNLDAHPRAVNTWGGSKTQAIQAGAFTVELGGVYHNVRIWGDASCSTFRVNFGAAATDAMAKCLGGLIYEYQLSGGVDTVYLFGDGITGNVNVQFWD